MQELNAIDKSKHYDRLMIVVDQIKAAVTQEVKDELQDINNYI